VFESKCSSFDEMSYRQLHKSKVLLKMCWLLVCWLLMCWYWPMIVHHTNAPWLWTKLLICWNNKIHQFYRLEIWRSSSKTSWATPYLLQIFDPFAEAENKTILLFENAKQEKYDSPSKQVKIIRFSFEFEFVKLVVAVFY
jgi:hypothetical protein